jgi:hypothetical protein
MSLFTHRLEDSNVGMIRVTVVKQRHQSTSLIA